MPRKTTEITGESTPVGAAEIAARLGVRPQSFKRGGTGS